MPYDTKAIKLDVNKKPVPIIFNPDIDDYEVLQGFDGATYFHQRGTMIVDFFEGTGTGAAQTITFSETVRGLYIKNTSLEDMTFTVGTKTATLEPDEYFHGLFRDPFNSISVTANGTFKGHINE